MADKDRRVVIRRVSITEKIEWAWEEIIEKYHVLMIVDLDKDDDASLPMIGKVSPNEKKADRWDWAAYQGPDASAVLATGTSDSLDEARDAVEEFHLKRGTSR